ncbi:MAG: DUF2017 family protein [Acidimicrobiales bacterium]|nr:DUF2017 family protein [Acidimicrobiales bacterium]
MTPPDEHNHRPSGHHWGDSGDEVTDADQMRAWSWGPAITILPQPDGTYFVAMVEPLRDSLRAAIEALRSRLLRGSPSIQRLFPTAYPDHPDLEAEYRDLMFGELLESKLAALDLVEASVAEPVLTEQQLIAWTQVINSARLALGTELEVEETGLDLDDDDPRWPAYILYERLGLILASIVDVLPV